MKNQFAKILFILAVFHLAGLISCNGLDDDLDCGPFKRTFYEVTEMRLLNFKKEASNTNIPSDYISVEDSSAVFIGDFRLAIGISVEYFTDNSFQFNNPFIQSALACSPPPAEAVDTITKIEITSTGDLVDEDGNLIPAGASLTEFFQPEWENQTLVELIDSGIFQPSVKFGTDDMAIGSELLKLNAIPVEIAQPHQFSIVYELDSGNTFTATSPTILLNP